MKNKFLNEVQKQCILLSLILSVIRLQFRWLWFCLQINWITIWRWIYWIVSVLIFFNELNCVCIDSTAYMRPENQWTRKRPRERDWNCQILNLCVGLEIILKRREIFLCIDSLLPLALEHMKQKAYISSLCSKFWMNINCLRDLALG